MTSSQYNDYYDELKSKYSRQIRKFTKLLNEIFQKHGIGISNAIKNTDGNVEMEIEPLIQDAIREVDKTVFEGIPGVIFSLGAVAAGIESRYIWDAWQGLGGRLKKSEVEELFSLTTKNAIERALATGDSPFNLNFTNISKYFSDDVVAMVRASLAQGRDAGKIAEDVNVFVKNGKAYTIKRWGERLEPQSVELLKRIKYDKVDYRALRLARSELGRSMMEVATSNGRVNPGATELWDWIRLGSIDWGCSCPGYEAGSPYKLEDLPSYPHPHCQCTVRPRMRNGGDFRKDLETWASGGSVPYIESWYRGSYLSR